MFKRLLIKKKKVKFSDFLRSNKIDFSEIKRYHSKYLIHDPFITFDKNTNKSILEKFIKNQEKNFNKIKSQFDQKILQEIEKKIANRTTSSEEIPEKIGDYYYLSRTHFEEDRDYINIYRFRNPGETPSLIIEPIKDGIVNKKYHKTFKVEKLTLNDNHDTIALLVDLENNENPQGYIKNIDKNFIYKDKIPNCYNMVFSKNSKFLYYVRLNKNLRPYAVFKHKLNTSNNLTDEKILEEKEEKFFVDINVVKSKDFFVVFSSVKETHKIYLKERKFEDEENEQFILINGKKEGIYSIEKTETGFYVLKKSENKTFLYFVKEGKFLEGFSKLKKKSDVYNYEEHLIFEENFEYEILYEFEKEFTLTEVDFFNDYVILYITTKGQNKLIKIDMKEYLNSKKDFLSFIPIKNKFGNLSPLSNININTDSVFFAQDTPFSYNETFSLDLQTDSLKKIKESDLMFFYFKPKNYTISERSYRSEDGEEIPVILIHNKNKDVDNPVFYSKTIVRFYGCYGLPTEIGLNTNDWLYLENNWIIALPMIRGSGDKGVEWHQKAIREKKYKSILDILGCFEYLIGSGLTHPAFLCATSSSAGAGLLASAMNFKPHLLKAVILTAPFLNFLDLLSDKTLPLAESDHEEFGDPSNLKHFQTLYDLCPYNNIKNKEYPPVLLNCFEDDYRTPLWHILKYMDKFIKEVKDPIRVDNNGKKNIFLRVRKGSHNGSVLHKDLNEDILEEFIFFNHFTKEGNKEISDVNFSLRLFK